VSGTEPAATVRIATLADVDDVVDLYHRLAQEQSALRPLWEYADGIDEPVEESVRASIVGDDRILYVAQESGAVVGFLEAVVEGLLQQGGGEKVGVIRLIYTLDGVRGVGVGDTMLERALADFRAQGIKLFDARVSPGHRNAKNFFEAHGFKARLIVMHAVDDGGLTGG
jgi:ribosomal protein S18 acetylase RimI-like enzyme